MTERPPPTRHSAVLLVPEMLGHLLVQRGSNTSLVNSLNSPFGPASSNPRYRPSATIAAAAACSGEICRPATLSRFRRLAARALLVPDRGQLRRHDRPPAPTPGTGDPVRERPDLPARELRRPDHHRGTRGGRRAGPHRGAAGDGRVDRTARRRPRRHRRPRQRKTRPPPTLPRTTGPGRDLGCGRRRHRATPRRGTSHSRSRSSFSLRVYCRLRSRQRRIVSSTVSWSERSVRRSLSSTSDYSVRMRSCAQKPDRMPFAACGSRYSA